MNRATVAHQFEKCSSLLAPRIKELPESHPLSGGAPGRLGALPAPQPPLQPPLDEPLGEQVVGARDVAVLALVERRGDLLAARHAARHHALHDLLVLRRRQVLAPHLRHHLQQLLLALGLGRRRALTLVARKRED